MSYEFLNQINELGMQRPETLLEYVLRELKIMTRVENLHLTGKAFYQLKLNFKQECRFLIAIPQNLVSLNARKSYINSYKTYLSLEKEGCVRNFVARYCNYNINLYQLNNDEIPLETYLNFQQISQQTLLGIAQQLLRAIQTSHEKIYFLEHLDLKTVYIDIISKQIKLLNPLQKLALQEEVKMNESRKRREDLQRKVSNQSINSSNEIQINQSSGPASPKGNLKINNCMRIGNMIHTDNKKFIDCILAAAQIRSQVFEEMIELGVIFSFFQRKYKGFVSKSMQYFLIYLWKVQKDDLSFKLSDIEVMIAIIQYSEIKGKQAKQFFQQQSSKTNPLQVKQNGKENSHIIKVKSEMQLGKERISQLLSQQKLQGQQQQQQQQQQISNNIQTKSQQCLKGASEKKNNNEIKTTKQGKYQLEQEKQNEQKQSPKLKQSTSSNQFKKENQNNFFDNFSELNYQSKFNFTQETFSLNTYSKCVKEQTVWLNRISNQIKNTQDAYFIYQKIQRKKEKTNQDWKQIAWILFKYDKFFVEPLEILKSLLFKVKNNQNQAFKINSQGDDDECYSMMGIINYKWRKYLQAIQDFKCALKINPLNQIALYYLGKSYSILEKDVSKGKPFFLQLVQVNPFNGDLIRKITKFIAKFVQPLSEIVYWLFLAVIVQPKCSKTLLMVIKEFLILQNDNLAKFFCLRGIEINSKEKEFYFILGQIFFKQFRLRNSLKSLIKANRLNHQQAALKLCHLYAKQDDLEELELCFYKKIRNEKCSQQSQLKYTLYLYN